MSETKSQVRGILERMRKREFSISTHGHVINYCGLQDRRAFALNTAAHAQVLTGSGAILLSSPVTASTSSLSPQPANRQQMANQHHRARQQLAEHRRLAQQQRPTGQHGVTGNWRTRS